MNRFMCYFRSKNSLYNSVDNSTDNSIRDNIELSKNITSINDKNNIGFIEKQIVYDYDTNEWLTKIDIPIEWHDTLPFVPPIEKGICIKVYDGDTITIASKLPYPNSPLYRFSVRLNGIDCPEIKGKDQDEKECAQLAKKEMTELVLNKVVTLKNCQTEKYGRILADVYMNDMHLNNHMIAKRLAVYYNGGTKIIPKSWLQYYTTGEL